MKYDIGYVIGFVTVLAIGVCVVLCFLCNLLNFVNRLILLRDSKKDKRELVYAKANI